MKDYIEERVIELAHYIIENKSTVRATAKKYNISKSTVHKDITDRLGMLDEYTNIMGINIPSLTIPVKPGRNLAIIIEVASMNNRQKRMGYNAAVELNNRLMNQLSDQLGN